jgi:hypothetical protein
MTADARRDAISFNLMLAEDVGDDVRDVVEFHDLAVNYRVRLQVLITETDQFKTATLAIQLNGFDRA